MYKKVEREALEVGALIRYLQTFDPALKMAVELVGRPGGPKTVCLASATLGPGIKADEAYLVVQFR